MSSQMTTASDSIIEHIVKALEISLNAANEELVQSLKGVAAEANKTTFDLRKQILANAYALHRMIEARSVTYCEYEPYKKPNPELLVQGYGIVIQARVVRTYADTKDKTLFIEGHQEDSLEKAFYSLLEVTMLMLEKEWPENFSRPLGAVYTKAGPRGYYGPSG